MKTIFIKSKYNSTSERINKNNIESFCKVDNDDRLIENTPFGIMFYMASNKEILWKYKYEEKRNEDYKYIIEQL